MITMIFYTLMLMPSGQTTPIQIVCGYENGVRVCQYEGPRTDMCLPVMPIAPVEKLSVPDVFCEVRGNHAVYSAQ